MMTITLNGILFSKPQYVKNNSGVKKVRFKMICPSRVIKDNGSQYFNTFFCEAFGFRAEEIMKQKLEIKSILCLTGKFWQSVKVLPDGKVFHFLNVDVLDWGIGFQDREEEPLNVIPEKIFEAIKVEEDMYGRPLL